MQIGDTASVCGGDVLQHCDLVRGLGLDNFAEPGTIVAAAAATVTEIATAIYSAYFLCSPVFSKL